MSFLRRKWKWFAGGFALLVVLLVGGPFVYIHFIESPAPPPLALPTATTNAAATPSGGAVAAVDTSTAAGTWTVGTGSQAGYRAKEVLFGQSTTAVGRTSKVTGTMTVTGTGAATTVSAATFTVDMTSVSSDQGGRDSQFQGRIMDTADYPTSSFTLTAPIALGQLPAVGTAVTEQASGTLLLRGKTKAVTMTLMATRTAAGGIDIVGTLPVTFADYGIDNPSGGPASVGDSGTMEVLLDLTRAAA